MQGRTDNINFITIFDYELILPLSGQHQQGERFVLSFVFHSVCQNSSARIGYPCIFCGIVLLFFALAADWQRACDAFKAGRNSPRQSSLIST
eukprot:7051251-Ditylum_brightwellii.AAC.1